MNANFMNMDFADVKSMSERNFGKIIHWVWERNFGDHLIIPVAQFIVPLAVTFSPLVLAFRANYIIAAAPAAVPVVAEQQYMAPGKQFVFWSVLIGGITNINILFSSLAGSCIAAFTYNGRDVERLSGAAKLLDSIANYLGSPYLSLTSFSKSIVELGSPLTPLLRAYYISTIISMNKSNKDSNDVNTQDDAKVDGLISKIFDFSTDKISNMLYAFVKLHIKLISYDIVHLGEGIDKGAVNTMPQYFGCEILDYIKKGGESVEALGLLAYICDYLENDVSIHNAQVDISEENSATEKKVEEVVSIVATSSIESCIVSEDGNIIQSSSAESDTATLSGNSNTHAANNEL